jgi:hypothetical protein
MSSANPFTPTGNTVTFTATTTAPVGVQAVSNGIGSIQYLVQNAGTAVVFLGVGASNTAAQANAVTVTSTGPAIPLLAGSIQVLTFAANAFFSGNATTSSVVYITPGDGA